MDDRGTLEERLLGRDNVVLDVWYLVETMWFWRYGTTVVHMLYMLYMLHM